MKKLLLASILMAGISSFAFAQTPEAVKAKKEAAKKGTAAPAISTYDNKTAADSKKVKADKPVETDDMKAAKIKTTDQESVKPVEKTDAKVAETKKAAKPAKAKKIKGS